METCSKAKVSECVGESSLVHHFEQETSLGLGHKEKAFSFKFSDELSKVTESTIRKELDYN